MPPKSSSFTPESGAAGPSSSSGMSPKSRHRQPPSSVFFGDGGAKDDPHQLPLLPLSADEKSKEKTKMMKLRKLGIPFVGLLLLLWATWNVSSFLSTMVPSLSPAFDGRQSTSNSKNWMTDYHDVCIVGAGLSGSVIAERYASERQQSSLILERRDHIGGNCFDYIDEETKIRVSKYGAHLFHTYFERVWTYVHQFSDWTPYEHHVLALIHGHHVPVPVNIDTVNTLFNLQIKDSVQMDEWLAQEQLKLDGMPKNSEEMALSRVGKRLYELIFHPYTIKQWDKEPRDLGPEVTARIPVRNNFDGRYFADPHQALPSNGYTAIFENMLGFKGNNRNLINVQLNTDFFNVRSKLKCGKLYYTGPIDRYFSDLGWDKLEYRSLDFERRVVKNVGRKGFYQPIGVVNHPNATTNFTRIVEYKHFLNQTHSPHTILFLEHSKDGGEPYYPVPNPSNKDLFQKYKDMASREKDVRFVGRLANYKYFNMDQTIENALALFDDDTTSLDIVISMPATANQVCKNSNADNWIQHWSSQLQANNSFVYASPSCSVANFNEVRAFDESKATNAMKQHMDRQDLQFSSWTLFVNLVPDSPGKDNTPPLSLLQQARTVMEPFRRTTTSETILKGKNQKRPFCDVKSLLLQDSPKNCRRNLEETDFKSAVKKPPSPLQNLVLVSQEAIHRYRANAN